ncbi:MAG: J domain-containing protein [Beijerinckiaceae bacterium]|nr:J domain-containing protein [Beijerinckiaceae bacterium]
MRDPYTILGVSKSATADEIKKAYRRLAKKHHPDQNTSDPKAKEKFSEANSAYEILGDAEKRGKFDRGEIDAEGKPRYSGFEGFGGGAGRAGAGGQGNPGWQHFEFDTGGPGGRRGPGGFDPSDIFSDLFGGAMGRGRRAGPQGAQKGDDLAATVAVPLQKAVKGGEVRVALPTGRMLDVNIPAGIESGKQIRLRGQGQPSQFGGGPGDVILTVNVLPHPTFRIEGRDLRLDLPVTLYEAALGGAVEVPTLDGAVEMNVPANCAGKTLRLRGKGLPKAGDKPAGDLLVTLRAAMPESTDAEFEDLMRKWKAEKPYNPRKGM